MVTELGNLHTLGGGGRFPSRGLLHGHGEKSDLRHLLQQLR
jgi:hypothetical protein